MKFCHQSNSGVYQDSLQHHTIKSNFKLRLKTATTINSLIPKKYFDWNKKEQKTTKKQQEKKYLRNFNRNRRMSLEIFRTDFCFVCMLADDGDAIKKSFGFILHGFLIKVLFFALFFSFVFYFSCKSFLQKRTLCD